jgi:hydrogenase assembly chaperone HypC/HupF
MDLSLPARVVALKKETATVEMNGARLTVRRGSLPNLSPGDWVLIMDDTITNVISPEEARAKQDSWSELVEILTNAL